MLLLFSFILFIRLNLQGPNAILWPYPLQLVHRWLSTLCSYLSGLPVQYQPSLHSWNGPWNCYEREARIEKSKKAFGCHFPPWLNPAPGVWARLFRFCLSIDDDTLPGLHLRPPPLIAAVAMQGRDKKQQDALIFLQSFHADKH